MAGKIIPADSIDSKVESLVTYFNQLVPISDYEKGIIRNMVRSIGDPLPATKVLVENKIEDMISLKADINYLILRLRDIRRDLNIPHMDGYNMQFMILTKQGRPSNESKIAEIYALNENLRGLRDSISDLDNLLDFMVSNLGLIDGKIKNLESRKYTL